MAQPFQPNASTPSVHEHKFLTLDAMRGIAALAVVQLHADSLFHGKALPHSYLAVDFFFLLSGFVLAHAYQARLDAGWSAASFLRVRLVRLYPLYLLGLALGVFYFAVMSLHTLDITVSGKTFLAYILLGLAGIPVFAFTQIPAVYAMPLNFPMWSLFGESVVNVFHALFLRRKSLRFLRALVIATALPLLALTVRNRSLDFGARPKPAEIMIFRVLFPYVLGVYLFLRRREARPRWQGHLPALAPCLLLLLALAVPCPARLRLPYDLVTDFIVFPAVLLLGAATTASGRTATLFRQLGLMSYALYAVHAPLLRLYQAALQAPHLHAFSVSSLAGVIFMLLVVPAALLADKFYDLPLRAFLRRTRSQKALGERSLAAS